MAYNVKRHTKGAKSKPWQRDTKCWTCSKQGHVSNECNDKKKDNKDKKREREKKKNETKVAFLAGNFTAISDTGWIIDSAATYTCHPTRSCLIL